MLRRDFNQLLAGLGISTVIGNHAATGAESDPLDRWRGAKVRPVSATPGRHTIHSYYLANPESPDGSKVLYYASTAANGHVGDLCVFDRQAGTETVVARNINTEDAHRAACQQWTAGGRSVAYHDVRDGRWYVIVVDLNSGGERVVAEDHQLSFGQPKGQTLPIYGCHWNPGKHRDLELLDVSTGQVRKPVTIDVVKERYGAWLAKEFGEKQVSVFFPITSPDERRVFFKIAAGSGGNDYRSKGASQRQGLIVYDLAENKFLFLREKWGHPAWHPDSRKIIEMGNMFLDAEDNGKMIRLADLPPMPGCHPSVHPDGSVYAMDGLLDAAGPRTGDWGVIICDSRGGKGRFAELHRFDTSQGAKSCRKNHPHPVFSADGRRLYFNVNSGEWTQLFVAEATS